MTTAANFRNELVNTLRYVMGRDPENAVSADWLSATMIVARRLSTDRWIQTSNAAGIAGTRRVYYLSLEFMIGRILEDALRNLDILDIASEALSSFGVDPLTTLRAEVDPALGNGGLGRLAACFLESMASLGYPGFGYGIRYEQGLFKQEIADGWQRERPDDWTKDGVRWEFRHPDISYAVGFGGSVDPAANRVWTPASTVQAMAHDYPVVGWQGRSVLTLRLWSAHADEPMDLAAFDRGDYVTALAAQSRAEAISQLLYPNDSSDEGKRLRLSQEYFFCTASVRDIVSRYLSVHKDIGQIHKHVCIQLNDTHPAIAIPELVRILVDEYKLPIAEAWEIAQGVFNYTNHTLLPEALESWHLGLIGSLLPRHLQIIYELNALVLQGRRTDPNNSDPFLSDISMIDEHGGGSIRMGHLAFLGSKRTNGVSALHSDLVKSDLFAPLDKHFPERIVNVTNGVTQRRWLNGCNPNLAGFLNDSIGRGWLNNLSELEALEPFASKPDSQQAYAAIKRENKAEMAAIIKAQTGIIANPDALFDSQIKRMHEYKRQLMNVLHAIALYLEIKQDGKIPAVPRVKIFSGKAAASYQRAKEIICLIHAVADLVNNDPDVRDHLQVVFLPNYNVSLAEQIIPASDLSEQISTAGMEASGTGNMKFALNGALTIGTLDGANVEIREQVGAENFELFGLTADEVLHRRRTGSCPSDLTDPEDMKVRVLASISKGLFSAKLRGQFDGMLNDLRLHDYFLVLADFDDYCAAQKRVDASFSKPEEWTRRTMLNTARMGYFSSDRSITDYAEKIWKISPLCLK